jgi:lipoprotein-anchoring transpeptidase ErfK/SrfK
MRKIAIAAAAAFVFTSLTGPAYAGIEQEAPFFLGALTRPAQPTYQYAATSPRHDPTDDESVGGNRPTREMVAYRGSEAAGTVVVNTAERRLYYVLGGGRAIRYTVGVGREGFQWAGSQSITNKQEWPDWRPPADMIRRRPDLPRYMTGGPHNPLGARAMYLGNSIYRIHGSNEPETIGRAVSSGCIRMLNEDVVDLYQRVKVGTRVVVLR